MTDQVVVRRYAAVLLGEPEASVPQDMRLIREVLEGSRALRLCLDSPVIAREKKRAVLEAVFQSKVHATTMRFVRLLTMRKREALLLQIAQSYRGIRDERLGITRVEARVRYALSEEEARRIQQVLEKKLSTEVRLDMVQDASIVGGIIVRVGDVVYDGSVTNQLAQLRRQIN